MNIFKKEEVNSNNSIINKFNALYQEIKDKQSTFIKKISYQFSSYIFGALFISILPILYCGYSNIQSNYIYIPVLFTSIIILFSYEKLFNKIKYNGEQMYLNPFKQLLSQENQFSLLKEIQTHIPAIDEEHIDFIKDIFLNKENITFNDIIYIVEILDSCQFYASKTQYEKEYYHFLQENNLDVGLDYMKESEKEINNNSFDRKLIL